MPHIQSKLMEETISSMVGSSEYVQENQSQTGGPSVWGMGVRPMTAQHKN
jgi:hypothetical protein